MWLDHWNASFAGDDCQLSSVQAVVFPPARLLCTRHTGTYADVRMAPFAVDDQLWSPLADWAHAEHLTYERTKWVIVSTTPP